VGEPHFNETKLDEFVLLHQTSHGGLAFRHVIILNGYRLKMKRFKKLKSRISLNMFGLYIPWCRLCAKEWLPIFCTRNLRRPNWNSRLEFCPQRLASSTAGNTELCKCYLSLLQIPSSSCWRSVQHLLDPRWSFPESRTFR
jgi:hypothetical protein